MGVLNKTGYQNQGARKHSASTQARRRRDTRSLSSGLWPSALASHQICWPRRPQGRVPGARGLLQWPADTAGGEFRPAL